MAREASSDVSSGCVQGAAVTDLLERAFAEASKLAPGEQDALAAWILDELVDERRWDAALAASTDGLARLADEALAEHREGRSRALDPDTL